MEGSQAHVRGRNNEQDVSPTKNISSPHSKQIGGGLEAAHTDQADTTSIPGFSKPGAATASPTDSQVTFGAPDLELKTLNAESASQGEAMCYTPPTGEETPNNKQSKRTREVENEDQEPSVFEESEESGSRKRHRAAIAGEQKLEDLQEMYPFRNKGSGRKKP